MTVFVDTTALYAILDRDDGFHSQAKERWDRYLSQAVPLLVTNYIAVETCALVQRRLGLEALRAFLNDMMPALQLEWITLEDHLLAVAAVVS